MAEEESGAQPPQQPESGTQPKQQQESSTQPPQQKRGVRPWVWWIIGAVILVALLGGFWLLRSQGQISVPNVVGQTQIVAESALRQAGLQPGPVSEEATLAATPGVVLSQNPRAGATVSKEARIALTVSVVPTVKVADVLGHTQSDAEIVLAEQGLRASVARYVFSSKVPAGEVTEQAPAAGTETTVTSVVELTVSKGKQQGTVPDVVTLPQDDAKATLSAAGYTVATVKATSTSIPAGNVISQSPIGGAVAASGSTVTITVSTGSPATSTAPPPPSAAPPPPSTPPTTAPEKPKMTKVPDVIGFGVLEAVTTIQKAELKVAFAWEKSAGNFLKVVGQKPSAGSSATPGDTVTITIGLPEFSFQLTPTPLPTPSPTPTPTPTPPTTATPKPLPAPSPSPSPSAPATP